MLKICEYCEAEWKRARTEQARTKFIAQGKRYSRPAGACCRCGDVVGEASKALPNDARSAS